MDAYNSMYDFDELFDGEEMSILTKKAYISNWTIQKNNKINH